MGGRALGRLAPMSRCLLVSGLPCAGKTTLARRIAARYDWPLLSKDDYKERIFNERGARDRAWSREVSALAWTQLLEDAAAHVAREADCVLEGNFRAREAEAVRAFAPPAELIELHCVAESGVLLARYRARAVDGSRHPGHVDLEALAELEAELERPGFSVLYEGAGRLVWDTTAGIDADAVLAAIVRLVGSPRAGARPGR